VADLASRHCAAEGYAVHFGTMLAENVGHVRCKRELSDELVVIACVPIQNQIRSSPDSTASARWFRPTRADQNRPTFLK
jgi:hypothetical protein